jgi:malonyl-CoA O-methyltransferase
MTAAQQIGGSMHDDLLPRAAIARSFGAAAGSYDAHAALQKDVATRLLALRPEGLAPRTMLDLGCGTGFCTQALQASWPQAQLLALDIALPMLAATARRAPRAALVCADAAHLPLASNSCDLVVSSLAIQWCRDYAALFRELARVSRPGATLMLSTFGPESLKELRAAWAAVDAHTHVNEFSSAGLLQRAAESAGLRCRLQREIVVEQVASLQVLSRNLKAIGAHNVNRTQAPGLTSPRKFSQAAKHFAAAANSQGLIPLTWELYYLVLELPYETTTA